MKALVVYDSQFGNTGKLANAMADAISGDATARLAGETSTSGLEGVDLLIVGSPTQAGRPTKSVQSFLKGVSGPLKVATFDTRMSVKFAKIFGYAADRMAKTLQKQGGTMVAPAEAFFVVDREGPLKEGELQRAADWARTVRKNAG